MRISFGWECKSRYGSFHLWQVKLRDPLTTRATLKLFSDKVASKKSYLIASVFYLYLYPKVISEVPVLISLLSLTMTMGPSYGVGRDNGKRTHLEMTGDD